MANRENFKLTLGIFVCAKNNWRHEKIINIFNNF